MIQVQNAPIIATLLKETPRPVFLLGAGASVTSGIPLAGEIVSKAAKWAFARQDGKDPDDPRITRSDWYPWLVNNHAWFKEDVPLASLFPYAVENLLLPKKSRKEFWVKLLNPDVRPSIGYLRLVELMHLGRVNIVLTTNFDECLLNARTEINRPHHIDDVRTPSEYIKISATPSYPLLVYLHGDVNNYSDKNVVEEVEKMDRQLVAKLIPILKDHPLVVIGYRGAEASIMQHLLLNNVKQAEGYKNGIYWCLRKGERPDEATPYVKELIGKIGSDFQFVEIDSFDGLFDKVIWSYLDEQKSPTLYDRSILLADQPEPVLKNFDLKNAKPYASSDFDEPLVRARVEKYCNRLKIKVPDRIDDRWLMNQLAFLNLIRQDKTGMLHTTNAGLLLFCPDLEPYISTAKTIIRFRGPTEWLQKILGDATQEDSSVEWSVMGNLWTQLNAIDDALSLINRPFRLKGTESKDVLPYDPLALKEVVVNSLVHRDYESDEANVIEITPGAIFLRNPGGLTDEVKHHFENDQMFDEVKRGKRGIKGYRNPVLADLFYGAGAMDKRGSGLSDVIHLVTENAGYVEFAPNLANTEFTVKMQCRPEAVDETTRTATPIHVITTQFSSNIIPIERLPERVYRADSLYSVYKEFYATYPHISFPPFEFFNGQLYTLTDLKAPANTLRNAISIPTIDSVAMDEYVGGTNGENRLVKLLNQSLKNHFHRLGLIVDDKKRRVYYPRTEEGERTIAYQARVKKAKRTVVRPRYAANKEKVRYWEHKAFYYAIKRFGNQWGLFIEPTYVFSLNGEKEMLASKRVGALATKKASRDYNLSVLNDLVFWMWVLSKGSTEYFVLKTSNAENLGDAITLSASYANASLNYVEYVDPETEDELEADDEELDNEIAQLADRQRAGILDEDEDEQQDDDEDLSDDEVE